VMFPAGCIRRVELEASAPLAQLFEITVVLSA
jgi:hypothetical protein